MHIGYDGRLVEVNRKGGGVTPSRTERGHLLRSPRMAALVADDLRSLILNGHLSDGDHLPREDSLRAQFGVGRPTMREALRILESEGLISIVRGNRGGATVHTPKAINTAYAVGLALTARKVPLGDLGQALREVEPLCAALCAARTDRRRVVLPRLRALLKEAKGNPHDPVLVTTTSRRFHEHMVASCGNQTLILVVGALETLWSKHISWHASREETKGSDRTRIDPRASLKDHTRIVELIEEGDVVGVREAVQRHLNRIQSSPTAANENTTIDVSRLYSTYLHEV